jgi:hypothetical protein
MSRTRLGIVGIMGFIELTSFLLHGTIHSRDRAFRNCTVDWWTQAFVSAGYSGPLICRMLGLPVICDSLMSRVIYAWNLQQLLPGETRG